MFTSLKNAQTEHVFAGKPLSPTGWRMLVEHLPHQLVPDPAILASYLSRSGFPSGVDSADWSVQCAQTLSLYASKQGVEMRDTVGLDWPHGLGELALNPLYVPSSLPAGLVSLRRRFPSASYERDNAAMADYLPVEVIVEECLYDRARAGRAGPLDLESLIAELIVIGVPAGYVADKWPAPV
jgi:hypothetical protein